MYQDQEQHQRQKSTQGKEASEVEVESSMIFSTKLWLQVMEKK
ncbi:hypothetical protein JPSP13_14960 [Staphylococcus pseudintermedius]